MALASLTVDLTLALARFEADSGKAAQIVARDQEKMSAGARAFERQLERLADQAGRTQGQFLSLKAAELGIGENTKAARLIEQIERQGTATAAATSAQVASIKTTTSAAEASADRQRALNDQLVSSIRAVNRAYEERRTALVAQEKAGQISPETLKTGLSGLGQQRTESIRQLKEQAALERVAQQQAEALAKADREAATAAEAAAIKQRAAAQQIVDGQNGLLASYRQRLALLRELRDAGQITPQQFRTAGTELVGQQPATQARRQEAEAAKAAALAQERAANQVAEAAEQSAARQRAAAQSVIDQQNGISASYRQRLAQLRELRDAELISPAQFRRAGSELVSQQPGVAARRAEAEAVKKVADEIAAAEKRKADAVAASTAQFVESLQRQADSIGKTRAQLILEEAARRGVADQVRPFVERISQAESSLNKFGRTSGVARYQLLTLQYTLSDTIASLASGISPLTILLQQGGQVADVFAGNGGVGGVFKTLGSIITPFRIGVVASAGAVAALGYALYQGAQQSKDFSDQIALTGNYAGLTEGRFKTLTRTIAASGEVNVAAAREFGQALIATGEVGGRNFDVATEAAARFGAATGKTAKEVASQFASLERDVSGGAATLNQQLNFLSASQLSQIRTLQDQGRATEALGLVYGALNDRLKSLEPNLGLIDRALRAGTNTWKEFWDAAFDVGRTQTIDQKLEQARKRLESAQRAAADPPSIGPYGGPRPSGTDRVERIQEEIRLLERSRGAQEEAARSAAELAKLNKDAAASDEFVRGFDRRAKAAEGLKRALEEAYAAFAKQDALAARDPSYKPSSAEQRASILKRIREDFTDKPATTEANQVAKAERDKALKEIQDSLKNERDAYTFHNQYLQIVYNAGQTSLEAFFAARREAAERDEKEQIDGLNKQIEAQRKYLDFIKARDPSEAVQTEKNIVSLQDDVAQATLARQRRVVVANAEEAASYRQLTERIIEQRAQILQLQGDEAGAARLRAQNAIAAAQLFSKQTGGAISAADVERQRRALETANEFAEVQRRVGIVTADAARAEELFNLRAEQTGASLVETERGVFTIRSASLQQLSELAAKAQELAVASSDPRIKAFAADLALQYAKASDAVDPTLNRLRAAGDDLGSSLARGFTQGLESAQKLGDFLPGLLNTIRQATLKTFITDPLEKTLQGGIRSLVDQNFGGAAAGAGGKAGASDAAAATAKAAAAAFEGAAAQSVMANETFAASVAVSVMSDAALEAAAALAAIAASSGSEVSSGILGLFGAGGSGSGGTFGDGFPMADGTNRVPYDGFRATLHRDEAVVPAKYNPAAGGRAPGGELKVNVFNTASDVVQTTARRNTEGELEVMVRRLVQAENARDLSSGGGPISSGLKMRGVRLDGGLPRRG